MRINSLILLFLVLSGTGKAQNLEEFQREQFHHYKDTLNYRILFPENFSEEKEYPLLLFLHGAGERGNDNEAQLVHGAELFLEKENREEFPVIAVFPQAPKGDYWANVAVERGAETRFTYKKGGKPTQALKLVMALMDSIYRKEFVDQDRIYVGGLSMGGMGTFEILSRKPTMFAAAFAICGGGHPKIARKYRDGLDVWIFHGKKDDVVPYEFSETMEKAINRYGGKAKLTLYEEANHNSWDAAFAESELLPWLFSKNKKD